MSQTRVFPLLLCFASCLCSVGCGDEASDEKTAMDDAGAVGAERARDLAGVDEVFLISDEEVIRKHSENIRAYGDDPIAIATSARYIQGATEFVGRDIEALPFLEFLENEDWSEGWLREYEVMSGRASLSMFCVAALGRIAFLPDNTMSDEIRERSIAQVARLGTAFEDSWEAAAMASMSLRFLVGDRPHFEVTEEPYAGWLRAWDIDPRVSELVNRTIYVSYPEQYGVDAPPMPEQVSDPD